MKRKNLLIIIVGIIAVLAIVGFFIVNNVLEKKALGDIMLKDKTEFVITETSESTISEVDLMLFENQTSETKYLLIVGSFKDVENAKKLQYVYPDAKLLPVTDSGFHRVSILEYDNYKDCLKKSKAFKENNGDAWILIK